MTYDWNRLAHRIRQRRASLGLTQAEVAQRAGVTPMTVRNLENGREFRRIPSSLGAVEAAIGWEPTSARAVLNGGEPTLRRENPDETSGDAKASSPDLLASTGAKVPPEIRLTLADGEVVAYTLVALPGETDASIAMMFVHPSTYETAESRAELRRRANEFRRIAARVSKLDPELSTLDTPPDAHE